MKVVAIEEQSEEQMLETMVRAVKEPSFFVEMFLGMELYDYNKEYVNDLKRWILYRAGRKVGKTTSTACKALYYAFYAPLLLKRVKEICRILIVAPAQKQANIMMDEIKLRSKSGEFFSSFIIKEKAEEIHIGWATGTGYTQIMTTAAGDTGNSVRGFQPHIVIVDECAFIKQRVITALIPSILAQKGHVWLTSTPFGKIGYFFEKSMKANVLGKDKKKRWHEHHVSSLQNPEIANDPDAIEELKDSMTEEEYKQEALGEFSDDAGTLIARQLIIDAISDVRVGTKSLRYFIGVDIAGKGKDETVFTLIGVDDNGKVYVKKVFAEGTTNAVRLIERLEDWCKDYPIERIYMDETARGGPVVDMALSKGLDVVGITFTRKAKMSMYRRLVLLFESHLIKIPNESKLINQLAFLRMERMADHIRIEAEHGQHDDYPDSLALACSGLDNTDTWSVMKEPMVETRSSSNGRGYGFGAYNRNF